MSLDARAADAENAPTLIPAAPDAQRAQAQALDAAIAEIDWHTLPDGAVRSRFAAPSGELSVVSMGDPADPRVVLVPGVTGSKEDFTLLIPLLVAGGYFVQSYDLAGQFESAAAGPPAGEHYTDNLFVNDLLAFLESGGPAHLLGYSFAGTIAQLAAVRRPDLCVTLAFLTTPPLSGQVFRKVKGVGWLSGLAGGKMSAAVMIWGIMWNLNRVSPMRIRFVRDRMHRTRRSSVSDVLGLMRTTPNVEAEIAALPVPKLVVAGKGDLWTVAQHRAFADRIGARAAIYDSGHRSPEMAPHELALDLTRLYHDASADAARTNAME